MLVFGAIAGMVLLVACGAANAVIWNEIPDWVESGIPLSERLSWKFVFPQPRVDPRVVLREHAAKFPNSSLRLWFRVTHAIPMTLVATVVLLAIWNSGRNHPQP